MFITQLFSNLKIDNKTLWNEDFIIIHIFM
jgi:hypothetical protein